MNTSHMMSAEILIPRIADAAIGADRPLRVGRRPAAR